MIKTQNLDMHIRLILLMILMVTTTMTMMVVVRDIDGRFERSAPRAPNEWVALSRGFKLTKRSLGPFFGPGPHTASVNHFLHKKISLTLILS